MGIPLETDRDADRFCLFFAALCVTQACIKQTKASQHTTAAMASFKIEHFLPIWAIETRTGNARIDFLVLGEPKVHNGWKVKRRGIPYPRIYDPRAREKKALRSALKRAMADAGMPHPPAFPLVALRRVSVHYFYGAAHDKDLDNMTKFLGDAMEGAIFPNDRCIKEMHLYNEESNLPKTIVSVEMAYRTIESTSWYN
jgi:Holliday junction resolvase RusA-like endonuclease